MDVVVVESPAKAKTINRYLGEGYKVLASYGHVRDLPSKDGSVQPDEDFAMTYEVDPRAKKHLGAIAKALRGAAHLYLATDPDREGEAISWHVHQVLEKQGATDAVKVRRVVFNQVTRRAVVEAFERPRDIDMSLVNAQQARRALDYLVGFTLSPVLWRKLPGARSAGRVQSVALRLICERELEIEAFVPQEYWTVEVELATSQAPEAARFTARLTALDGDKLGKFSLPDETAAKSAVATIASAPGFAVAQVTRKEQQRRPPPPFTTSTLQQEASRKIGLRPQRTMQVAQRLYEGVDIGGETVGLITYMRTDGVQIAGEAVAGCRSTIAETYGQAYLPEKPRAYRSAARNAQEAHEAIRPTDLGRLPAQLAPRLDRDQQRLYELIWKRTVASQMASARFERATVDIAATDGSCTLRATGSITLFDGFLRLYREGRDDQPDGDEDRSLPHLKERQPLARGTVTPSQHFTEPAPRFSEATLVKRLEELGIGRPSTYAGILAVLQDRDYVRLEGKRFVPEDRGQLVTAFLVGFFERYVEYGFTADLERQLDEISAGRSDWTDVLRRFWSAFKPAVDGIDALRVRDVLDALNDLLAPHVFPPGEGATDPRACVSCGDGRLSLKVGRYGAFVGCSNYPDCRYTRRLSEPKDGDAGEIAADGPRTLGTEPDSGLAVTLRKGPYGRYLQLGEVAADAKPKRVAVPKGMSATEITIDTALALLSLPREVGVHPESGKTITAGIGRYGPFLRHDGAYVSIPAADDVLTIGLNRAVALLAEARPERRGGQVLRSLGEHPEGGEISVMKGRYGPYVTHGGINATLPAGSEPEALTLDAAVALLRAKAAKGRGSRRAPRKRKTRAASTKGRAPKAAAE